ncbi:MAG: hypothetical protein KDD77_02880, partial [Caldilineaceae bacterium]|nr:hypothetical protein [Caldilineaceae bacterium]
AIAGLIFEHSSAGGFGALAHRPCHPLHRLRAGFAWQTPVSNRRGAICRKGDSGAIQQAAADHPGQYATRCRG